MRRLFNTLLVLLELSAVATAESRGDAQDSGWRPTNRHSTVHRSEFQQRHEEDRQPIGGNRAVFNSQPVVRPNRVAAGDGGIQQTAQSPEVGTIESPIPSWPLADSYFPPDVDPDQPCPNCSNQPGGWITRNSTRLTSTWLPAGANDIGWTDFNLRTKLAFGALKNLSVQPGFQLHFIDGPTRTDLPERLYNTQVELRWKQQVSRPFWFEIALTPGVYSDFERSNGDAFRLKAQGLAFFAFSRETQLVAGLYYLDRFDINYLPIFGLIHSPREDIKLNLVFPAPKIAMRVWQGGWNDEWWAYLSGEFGGGSWAVERVPGALPGGRLKDQIAYSDWRLIVGLERKVGDGTTMFLEAGYVFNRQLQYDSGRGDFDPDDTVMLRAGLSY